MQLKQSRFTLLLFATVAVGIVVLVISLVILQHENRKTRDLRDRIDSLRAEYDTREQQLRHLKDDIVELDDLNARLAQLDKNLIAYEYVPTYLKQIQGTATRTFNVIQTIQPQERKPLDLAKSQFAGVQTTEANGSGAPAGAAPATQSDGASAAGSTIPQYQVMGINLDMQGSYSSLVKLLDEFRKFPKMVYVKSIDLTPKREKGQSTISARFSTYAIITPDQYKVQPASDTQVESHRTAEQPPFQQASLAGGNR